MYAVKWFVVICVMEHAMIIVSDILSDCILLIKFFDNYAQTFRALLVGHLFKMYVLANTTLPHSSFGRCFPINILLTMFMMVIFFLLAVPFC